MLSEKMIQALNKQINYEFAAAYSYFAKAAYCDLHSMDGFSHWMRVQAHEEIQHGMKIYNYLNDLGAPVVLQEVQRPFQEFTSFEEVFEDMLKSETDLAKVLNELASIALEERDQITYGFLKWFLDEQVEEIALTSSMVDKIKLVGGSGNGLFILNEEMKKRQLVDVPAEGE